MHGFWTKNKLVLGVATLIGGSYIVTSGYVPIFFYFYSDKKNVSSEVPQKASPVLGFELQQFRFFSWLPWKKNDIPVYWKLLKLAQSKSENVRDIAIKALTEMTKLDDSQYRTIAQSCDTQTAIRLARTLRTDPRFFLTQPFKDLKEGNMEMELHNLLQSLPPADEDFCVQLFTQRAIYRGQKFIDSVEFWCSEFEEPGNIYHYNQNREIANSFEKQFLQAVLGHSSISNHKKLMIDKGILKLFHKVLLRHDKDIKFKSLIAQILANLTMDEDSAKHMHATGWISVLAEWINSPHIQINLPAAKALANLNKEDQSGVLFDNGVYLLHPQFKERESKICADAVFVHGLLGSAFYTWRQNDNKNIDTLSKPVQSIQNSELMGNYTYCWPKDWLALDIPQLRILAIDYNTCISNWKTDCRQELEKDKLNVKAYELIRKLVLAGVGRKPIIWVAHSMGGLLVKQILIEASESKEPKINLLAKNTVAVVFFSVPHKGTELANIMQTATMIFQPSVDVQQLEKDSPELLNLHEKFKIMAESHNLAILSFGETKESKLGLHWSSILVSSDSSNPGFGNFFELPVDHLSSCKPETRQSLMYITLVEFFKKCVSNSFLKQKNL